MKSIVLIIGLVVPLISVSGQDAGEVLERMRETMAGLESYRVELTTEAVVRGPKEVREASTESVVMVKDGKQYREMKGNDAAGNPVDRVQVFDGKVNWDYDRIRSTARKMELAKMTKEIREEILEKSDPARLGPLADFEFDLDRAEDGEDGDYILRSRGPISMGPQSFDRVEIRVDRKSYLPIRVTMVSTMDFGYPGREQVRMTQEITQRFRGWEPGAEIEERIFSSPVPVMIRAVDETAKVEEVYRVYRQKAKEWREQRDLQEKYGE